METIRSIGQRGGDSLIQHLEIATPAALQEDQVRNGLIGQVRRFPRSHIEAETASGVKQTVGVHTLPLALGGGRVFNLAHQLAAHEPIVYAQVGSRRVLGMMSSNYGTDGSRLPSLKIIPLQTAYPLTAKLLPDADMATMLAGAVSAERRGVGDHAVQRPSKDLEHQATLLGAVSLGDAGVARRHDNHGVRASGSALATGLTNGKLGSLYAPSQELGAFTGFDLPLVISPHEVTATDSIFFPDSFLDNPEAWGGMYDEAPKIMLGAGMRVLEQRLPGDSAGLGAQLHDMAQQMEQP